METFQWIHLCAGLEPCPPTLNLAATTIEPRPPAFKKNLASISLFPVSTLDCGGVFFSTNNLKYVFKKQVIKLSTKKKNSLRSG